MWAARLTTLVAFLLASAGGGVAQAEPPWSEPVTIAAGGEAFSRPGLAFTGDGRALAALTSFEAPGPRVSRILQAPPGSMTFTEMGVAPAIGPPAVYGRSGVAVLRSPGPGRRGRTAPVQVSLGRAPGSLGRVRQLDRVDTSRTGEITGRVAGNRRGDVAVAWLAPRPRPRATADAPVIDVKVALRPAGQAFGRPRIVGQAVGHVEGGMLFDLALGAGGDLVVAWQRARARPVTEARLQLAVRVRRPGSGYGAPQVLGPSLGSSSVQAAVAATGSAVVAWGTQDGGEGVERPWAVRAALLRSGQRRFGRTRLLDPGRAVRPLGPVTAAIGGDGTATVAWTAFSAGPGSPRPVRVATARPGGPFGPSTRLTPSGVASGVVTAADGTTTVLWGALSDPEGEVLDQLFASRRPAGAQTFADPETITPRAVTVDSPAIALDPRDGRPAAVWVDAPGGERPDALSSQPRYSARRG